MPEFSRRDALRLTALATAIPAFQAMFPTAAGAATPATTAAVGEGSAAGAVGTSASPRPSSWVVKPFDNTRVTLAPSLFTDNRDRVLNSPARLLGRRACSPSSAPTRGSTPGAQRPAAGRRRTATQGHYAGHFLSALCLAYAGTGEPAHRRRPTTWSPRWANARTPGAWSARRPARQHVGYLAAYPETQYIRLEQYATYPTIWAPWYTCHMIMRGLLDAYQHTGNHKALEIVLGMGDWAYSRLGHLPRTQLDAMWKIYIAGEYNAMPVVMADLYALTKDEKYLTTAKCFDNTYLFDAAVANEDTITAARQSAHPSVPGIPRDLRTDRGARVLRRGQELLGHGGAAPHLCRRRHGGLGRDIGARDSSPPRSRRATPRRAASTTCSNSAAACSFHTADRSTCSTTSGP